MIHLFSLFKGKSYFKILLARARFELTEGKPEENGCAQ